MSTLATTNIKHASSGSNNIVLASDGTTTIAAPSNIIKSGTAVASTSGTAIDFTGIPSWVKRITLMFNGVSTNGSSRPIAQLGTSSGPTTSGYAGSFWDGTQNIAQPTSGIAIGGASSANVINGIYVFATMGSNLWVSTGATGFTNVASISNSQGNVTLSSTLDRIRITTVNGTDTFDAGTINILYEG